MWTRFACLLAILALTACQPDDTTSPGLEPVNPPLAAVYPRLYPDAPICPSGTEGAFAVRIHTYFAANPPSVSWYPEHTGDQLGLQAEVYSYTPTWQVCWNHWDKVTWPILDAPAPPLVTARDNNYTHYRIERFRHINDDDGGLDRVIACVSPRQVAFSAPVPGCAADTILVSWIGDFS
jgi:hypothetical protein